MSIFLLLYFIHFIIDLSYLITKNHAKEPFKPLKFFLMHALSFKVSFSIFDLEIFLVKTEATRMSALGNQ